MKHVMVVDDDHDVLNVTKKMLERNGYEVHGFDDPAKALTHGKDCKECGVVITDLQMPVMNGLQLVQALRKSRPEIKVVLMTAANLNSRKWRQTLSSASVDQFLSKPFRTLALVEAVEKCVPKLSLSRP